MKIHELRENLENTIRGKEVLLASLKDNGKEGYHILQHMLSMNIEELEKILADAKVAETQYDELSWTVNPERMGQ
jgi:dynactin complex subunit